MAERFSNCEFLVGRKSLIVVSFFTRLHACCRRHAVPGTETSILTKDS